MRRNRLVVRTLCAVVAATAGTALAACAGGGTKTVTQTVRAPAAATEPLTTTISAGSSGPPSTETNTDTVAETPDQVLVRSTVEGRGSRAGTIDLAVVSLTVRGKLMTLTLSFTPNYPDLASPKSSISLYDMNGKNPLFVSLIDPINLKRYVVLKDSSGQELKADEMHSAAGNNRPIVAEYTFAAPPRRVTLLDVQVGEWPTFADVPVKR